MKRFLSAAAMIAAGSILFASASQAQTKTDAVGMTLTVEAECTVEAAPIDFGSIGLISAAVDATADLTVQCTKGSPYQVGLSKGAGVGASTTIRKLTDTLAPTNLANYELYQDSDHNVPWGDTQGTDTVDVAAATGGTETIPIFASVLAGQSVAAGAYADTVTATIWYGGSIVTGE